MKSLGDYDKAGFDRIEPAQPKENPDDILELCQLPELSNMIHMILLKDCR
jgi:hypothetical protein